MLLDRLRLDVRFTITDPGSWSGVKGLSLLEGNMDSSGKGRHEP